MVAKNSTDNVIWELNGLLFFIIYTFMRPVRIRMYYVYVPSVSGKNSNLFWRAFVLLNIHGMVAQNCCIHNCIMVVFSGWGWVRWRVLFKTNRETYCPKLKKFISNRQKIVCYATDNQKCLVLCQAAGCLSSVGATFKWSGNPQIRSFLCTYV